MGKVFNNRNRKRSIDDDFAARDTELLDSEGQLPVIDQDQSAFDPTVKLEDYRGRVRRRMPKFLRKIVRKRNDTGGPRKPNPIKRKVGEWGDRLLGAAKQGSFSKQEEAYEAGQTRQDYLWNSIGLAAWGMTFPLFTIVATQLVGVEEAGRFSFAFMVGQLLMILANYGVRTYQVSDREQDHSFLDYQVNRWITCILTLVVGWVFCQVRGYDGAMITMNMWVFAYKMIDGLADVYEGRLQQVDKLYLAGMSQAMRSVAAIVAFALFLLFTRDLGVASIAMAVAAALTCVLFTIPLALLETPASARLSLNSIGRLFAQCAPVFAALFFYALIDYMPRFMMESMMSYDNQLYFNALVFPAQAILITVGLLYKPMLVRMSEAWNDLSRRRRFDLFLGVAVLVIVALTGVGVLLMAWIGIPLLSVLYGVDFEPLRKVSYIMICAGGITAGIDFLYQVMTIMRRQAVVMKLYLITFLFALAIPYALIRVSGLQGAALSYAIVMAVLAVLLLLEYVGVRMDYRKHPEDDPMYRAAAEKMGAPIPEAAVPVKDLVGANAGSQAQPRARRPRAQVAEVPGKGQAEDAVQSKGRAPEKRPAAAPDVHELGGKGRILHPEKRPAAAAPDAQEPSREE